MEVVINTNIFPVPKTLVYFATHPPPPLPVDVQEIESVKKKYDPSSSGHLKR